MRILHPTHSLEHFIANAFESLDRNSSLFAQQNQTSFPVSIYQNDGAYYVRVEVPGYSKDAITLKTEQHKLSVKIKAADADLERTLTIPQSVDVQASTAEFKDGILTVVLPKSKEAQARQIELN